ncbi:MAG: hypothetical protein BRD50_00790 [Bacteroidetes bacterium SW_11_45_7]|nr:MAG: hypothetical protein BRD50_00790 [Bacteroidetes bacterium SW_11_45_7]
MTGLHVRKKPAVRPLGAVRRLSDERPQIVQSGVVGVRPRVDGAGPELTGQACLTQYSNAHPPSPEARQAGEK